MVIPVFEMEGKGQICIWSQERAKGLDMGKSGIKGDPQISGLGNWVSMVLISLKNHVECTIASITLSVW